MIYARSVVGLSWPLTSLFLLTKTCQTFDLAKDLSHSILLVCTHWSSLIQCCILFNAQFGLSLCILWKLLPFLQISVSKKFIVSPPFTFTKQNSLCLIQSIQFTYRSNMMHAALCFISLRYYFETSLGIRNSYTHGDVCRLVECRYQSHQDCKGLSWFYQIKILESINLAESKLVPKHW